MERNERLDEIMKCSKEAIARAYMCTSPTYCPCGLDKCSFDNNIWCVNVTPQDWQEVLDERD